MRVTKRRIAEQEYVPVLNRPSQVDDRIANRSDAAAWGRTAAVLNWGLSAIDITVADEYQKFAKTAYENRMKQLHGAPF